MDLTIQVGKIEQFLTILANLIDSVLLPKCENCLKEFDKPDRGTNRNNSIDVDAIFTQTNYTYLLQLKGYFSLLADFSGMYLEVDRQFLLKGVELFGSVQSYIRSGQQADRMSQELARYTQESAQKTASLVNDVSTNPPFLNPIEACFLEDRLTIIPRRNSNNS